MRFVATVCVLGVLMSGVACAQQPKPAVSTPAATSQSPKTVAASSAPVAAGMSGKQILESKCAGCHDVSTTTDAPRASDDWAPILDRMVSFGAQLSDAERKTLETYLIESYSH